MKKILYVILTLMLFVPLAYGQGISNIDSHIVPITDNLDNLGSSSKGFKTIYTNNLTVDEIMLMGVTTKTQAQFNTGGGTITFTAAESGFVIITATDTATVVIPSTASVTSGTRYTVIDVGAGTDQIIFDVGFSGAGVETIGGSTTNADMDAQYDVMDIISVDGVGWLILNQISN